MTKNTSELYELICSKQQEKNKYPTLKIVIKYFNGTAIYISLSSRS